MPTRKQRRRRDKSRRHEYEYVYVDDEGNEVEVDPKEVETAGEPREPRKREPRRTNGAAKDGRSRGARAERKIEPPSLRRVARRGLFVAPLIVAVIWLTGGNLSPAQRISQALLLVLLFLPFSYLMDSLLYRSYRRRQEARAAKARSGAAAPRRS